MNCIWNKDGICVHKRNFDRAMPCEAEYEEDCSYWELSSEPYVYSVSLAAKRLNMTRQNLWKHYLTTKKLRSYKLGQITIIYRADLEQFEKWYIDKKNIKS